MNDKVMLDHNNCYLFWKTDTITSPIIKISEDLYKLHNITINNDAKEIIIPGSVNMQKGLIELVACAVGGKIHESIFVVDIVPYYLHVSLLLLGLNFEGGVEYQGDSTTPRGDFLEIYVKWKNDDKDTVVRIENCVWDIPNDHPMQNTYWVFTGSKIVNGIYMADVERSIITTYRDPYTIIDNPLSTGINDEYYRVNDKLVPPKGTPVTIIIKPFSKKR